MSDFELPKAKGQVDKTKTDEVTKEVSEKKEVETPKYSQDELLRIFDEMIFSGSYTEVVPLRGGKLKVAFRTRVTEETEAITNKIDTTDAKLMSTLVEKRTLLNLQYALVAYQGKDLSTMKFEDKVSFINKLPTPVVGMLMIELGKFDDKVYKACEEGELNF
jgi:hypothetical protein